MKIYVSLVMDIRREKDSRDYFIVDPRGLFKIHPQNKLAFDVFLALGHIKQPSPHGYIYYIPKYLTRIIREELV